MSITSIQQHTRPEATPAVNKVSIDDFIQKVFPPRQYLLSPWLPRQGLAMVYAPRGIGKTYFALNVAYACAGGGRFLDWQAPSTCRVLYIDGEMPAVTMQERLKSIIQSNDYNVKPDAIQLITPDLQGERGMPNLASFAGQALYDEHLQDIDLIIVDNISTLCRGVGENESESWDLVQEWALRQRSAGRTVLFVHHAGKNGQQRGTSKREDVLDTVINLKRPSDYVSSQGARFEVHFEKARGFAGDESIPLCCQLIVDEKGNSTWNHDQLEDSNETKVISLARKGLTQKEMESELKMNKSVICRTIKKAVESGKLSREEAENTKSRNRK